MIKKLLNIIFTVVLFAATLIMLGFSMKHNAKIPAKELDIKIDHNSGVHFLDKEDIQSILKKSAKISRGDIIEKGKLREIEKIISGIPHVERAHVYRNIDGSVQIEAIQRKPLIRVITTANDSYYIDENGKMLPLSPNYTARVMVATGNINSPYSPVVMLGKTSLDKKKSRDEKRLEALFHLASYISKEPFWSAFIDQIYITSSGEFELTPKNGNHVIKFGKLDNMDEKFRKLMVFYQNGLTRTGWHQYKVVNIKYNNQIICSK